MPKKTPLVYIVAGETSGDNFGAKLMAALKAHFGKHVRFKGVGGEAMQQQGMESLFPMSDLSLMGFAEIIPHIPKLLSRIKQTEHDIIMSKPDIVITIDLPGFNFRLAKRLQGKGIYLMHYVAPSVWAYKPERVYKVEALYDELLLLFPFEQPYFESLPNLKTTLIGHPLVEDISSEDEAKVFRHAHAIPSTSDVLCVLPGSRKSEIKRLWPVFEKALVDVKQHDPSLVIVIPCVLSVKSMLEKHISQSTLSDVHLIDGHNLSVKRAAFRASDVALAKSGTGAVELSFAKTALVVAYKVHALSYWWIKRLINVSFVNLINIAAGKAVIPECIQHECTSDNLSSHLLRLLSDKKARQTQIKTCQTVLKKWGVGGQHTPSQRAASRVIDVVSKT